MTVIEADWLTTLVFYANEPDVGIVGAKLLYPNNTVQHGGVVLGVQGVGAHRYGGYTASELTHLDATREMTAITGACIAMRRTVFEALGGFDPNLAVAFNDVRLCIRAFESGYRNIYVARPLLYHHESMSRGFDDTREKKAIALREAIYVRSLHGALFRDDPSYSPNLSLQRAGDLAVPPRYLVPCGDRRHTAMSSSCPWSMALDTGRPCGGPASRTVSKPRLASHYRRTAERKGSRISRLRASPVGYRKTGCCLRHRAWVRLYHCAYITVFLAGSVSRASAIALFLRSRRATT